MRNNTIGQFITNFRPIISRSQNIYIYNIIIYLQITSSLANILYEIISIGRNDCFLKLRFCP